MVIGILSLDTILPMGLPTLIECTQMDQLRKCLFPIGTIMRR